MPATRGTQIGDVVRAIRCSRPAPVHGLFDNIGIQASFKEGVLTIKVPRVAASTPRQIVITTS